MLGLVGVGPGDQQCPGGDVSRGRPYFLAVDDPPVTVTDCPRRQIRQVRSGAWLAEQLAPDLLARPQRPQPALLLLVGAIGQDRRGGHAQADAVAFRPVGRRASRRELRVDHRLQRPRQRLPAESGRVMRPGQAGVEPGAKEVHPLRRNRVVRGKEGAGLCAQLVRRHLGSGQAVPARRAVEPGVAARSVL